MRFSSSALVRPSVTHGGTLRARRRPANGRRRSPAIIRTGSAQGTFQRSTLPPHLGPSAGEKVPPGPYHRASPKCAFVLSRARDGFPGSAPSWVRLRSPLRGRFQATKGPDVALGTCVLSRTRNELNCYFLSRWGASGLTPAQDTTLKKMHNGGNTRRNRAQDELNRHVA